MAKKALTPEQIGQGPSEHSQQCAVFAWAARKRAENPVLQWLHAIPNGGDRDRVTAGRMKAEGVRRGVHDICLPVARGSYHGLYVELKVLGRENEVNGGRSDEQEKFRLFCIEQSYAAITAYGWEHATRVIAGYLGLGPYVQPSDEFNRAVAAPPTQPSPVAMAHECPGCGVISAGQPGELCGLCEMDEDTQALMDRDRE